MGQDVSTPRPAWINDPNNFSEKLGRQAIACHNNCFPKDLSSSQPCLPRCIFTEHGHGAPPAIAEQFEGKVPTSRTDRPLFIIAYGPPASGKSDIVNVLQNNMHHMLNSQMFGALRHNNTIDVNVDKIFQEGTLGTNYAEARKKLKSPLSRQRLYLYYRWIADQISDTVLNLALLNRYNITWETTGEAIRWTRHEVERIRKLGYTIVLVYPMVSSETIVERLEKRAKNEGQEPAPKGVMANKINSALENLKAFLLDKTSCMDGIITDVFSGRKCGPDRIIMYNNQLPKGEQEIIFDSDQPDGYREELERATTQVESINNLKQSLEKFKERTDEAAKRKTARLSHANRPKVQQ